MIEAEEFAAGKVEVVIGTSGGDDDETIVKFVSPGWSDEGVQELLSRLSTLTHNGGVPIEAFDLDVIASVRDVLDQLWYWSLEEAHQPCSPSPLSLANDPLLAVLENLFATNRPKIHMGVLKCLSGLMKHHSRSGPFAARILTPLLGAVVAFPRVEELVEEALGVLACMAQASNDNSELILTGDAVSVALRAMISLPQRTGVQRAGCLLIAALADSKRTDALDPPAALLMVHVGVVVDLVCKAYLHQPHDTQLSAAVAHTLAVAGSFPQNVDELVSKPPVLTTLLHLVEHQTLSPRIVQDAATCLSVLLNAMDDLQKRSLVLVIKQVMVRCADPEVLAAVIALLHRTVEGDGAPSALVNGDGGSGQSALKAFVCKEHLPQLVAVALDHFGKDDAILRDAALRSLQALVISKHR